MYYIFYIKRLYVKENIHNSEVWGGSGLTAGRCKLGDVKAPVPNRCHGDVSAFGHRMVVDQQGRPAGHHRRVTYATSRPARFEAGR